MVNNASPVCSIVIPTKNGGDLFHKALAGWAKQTLWSRCELIVVDSGSTDDTVEAAKQAGAKVFEIPPAEFNHGATRDYGISLASSDYIILTVQDAVPSNDQVLELLVNALEQPNVGGAYTRQIPQADADVITKRNLGGWSIGSLEREERFLKHEGWYDTLTPMEKHLFCTFDNVCSAIKKSVWEQEKFGRVDFGEDIDWSKRVLLRGYHIIYDPNAAVIHSHDRSLMYDYKRTYVCHRKLYQMYGLHLVPDFKLVCRAWPVASKNDMAYIWQHEPNWFKKIKMLLKSPLWNWLNIYGQYKAVQDELKGNNNTVKGI
ncbi:rhamnosyltransferase [uncultured bacterium]|nr:rhamnosyltransferase [uncultured bacterium]